MGFRSIAAISALLFAETALAAVSSPAPERPAPGEISAERRIEILVRESERHELVIPPAVDFKPKELGRKLRLTLVPRQKSIKVGERFWYRIEIQNVGSQPVRFREWKSFLKRGDQYASGRWKFELVDPSGKRFDLVVGTLYGELAVADAGLDAADIPEAEKMTDEEVREFIRRDAPRRRAELDLDVVLAPGETLVSRPWRWHDASDRQERKKRGETNLTPQPQGPWRELWVSHVFKEPGKHSISVTYDDPPLGPPSEDLIRAMEKRGFKRKAILDQRKEEDAHHVGVLNSEAISFEVVR